MSSATGRQLQYVPLSLEEFCAGMVSAMGPDMANQFTDLFTEILDGRNACLANGVQQALGRASRDFAAFCKAAAATGVWNVALAEA